MVSRFSTPLSTTPSAPSSGAASVKGSRAWWWELAPVSSLRCRTSGLIIIDEEHDGSYKQQDTPRYNGRDVAVMRAHNANACVVFGSATPSLETRYNVERGKYTLLELPERIEKRPMPEVELIDMRLEFLETRKQATFSRRLLTAIREKLTAGEQVMLLHNRRGFSSFVACRSCGERVQCVNCSLDTHVSSARPPHALPLLQLRRARAISLPEMQ